MKKPALPIFSNDYLIDWVFGRQNGSYLFYFRSIWRGLPCGINLGHGRTHTFLPFSHRLLLGSRR
jgi:hypothetical protein